MERIYTTHSTEETLALGRQLAASLEPGTFIALSGPLGAGKTTLAQGLLEGLGAEPPYASPTFIIMKLYELPAPTEGGIERIYHADAYRADADDIVKAGLEEWQSDPAGLVLFEWPERAAEVLPPGRTEVILEAENPTQRRIRVIR